MKYIKKVYTYVDKHTYTHTYMLSMNSTKD